MAKADKLSQRQTNILRYIWEYWSENGRPPTIREIGSAVKISSTSVVNYNLNKLEEKGFLEREAEVSRGLKLTDKALTLYGSAVNALGEAVNMIRVPLAGDIVAGEPVFSGNDDFSTYGEEEAIDVSASMLPKQSERLFALRVRGNSMIDAMVNDNDIVILKQTHEAANGDMVAVWLPQENETTLKYFFREGDDVRLQPANPTMEPIYVHSSNVEVQGKVMMVMRQTA
ncbi:MAG: transcriptional repressor LexA [Candidatus Promineifilaceae bacterium]|nr:transcriptional repressor LexA [Candidatus Promineifilaceae bacterium]